MDGSTEGLFVVVVPGSSPLQSLTAVQNLLTNLQSAVSALAAFANFLPFVAPLGLFVTSLQNIIALDTRFPERSHTAFRAADSIETLEAIHYWSENWGTTDINAAERMNALILIGLNNKMVECYNNNSFVSNEGEFTVETGSTNNLSDAYVTVSDLGFVYPPSDPSTALQVIVPPSSPWWK